jgi:FixJ family two-component response regulator
MHQQSDNHLIFIADDEPGILAMLKHVFQREGCNVLGFGDGNSLLDALRHATPACVLIDVNMPGKSGLEVLKALVARGYDGPILMISGAGDISMAVDAIHNGAWDFLEKPLRRSVIVERVQQSIAGYEMRRRGAQGPQRLRSFRGKELLTRRETEVLEQVVIGATSKEIGRTFGISPRTVEVHRSRILEKTAAKNLSELMRLVLEGANPTPVCTEYSIQHGRREQTA